MGLGPAAQYLVKYNGHVLPGYAQSEQFDNGVTLVDHNSPRTHTPLTEYGGEIPKGIQIKMKVWEKDYFSCKEQIQLAATYLRSTRGDYSPLYIQYTDRHYNAKTETITTQKEAGVSVRTADYDVTFKALPWIEADYTTTLSGGSGTLTTDAVGRTTASGTYSPVTLLLVGTNVTVSGFTDTGEFCGYLKIDGATVGTIVDSENYNAFDINGVNMNGQMLTHVDYAMYVGPGKTNFVITGATQALLSWNDRWGI